MLRPPTTKEFAVGAMLIGTFLLGVIVGATVANYEEFREWTAALSGYFAALAAGIAVYYMHQSNKIQKRAVLNPKLEELEKQMKLASQVAEDLRSCGKSFERLAAPVPEPYEPPPQCELWRIQPTGLNIERDMDELIFRDIEEAWQTARARCQKPEFDNIENEDMAAQHPITPADRDNLMRAYAVMMNTYSDIEEQVIRPRNEQYKKILEEMKL